MSSGLCLKLVSFLQNPSETTPKVRPKFWANVEVPCPNPSRDSRN